MRPVGVTGADRNKMDIFKGEKADENNEKEEQKV